MLTKCSNMKRCPIYIGLDPGRFNVTSPLAQTVVQASGLEKGEY
jgi:hypothetical protein